MQYFRHQRLEMRFFFLPSYIVWVHMFRVISVYREITDVSWWTFYIWATRAQWEGPRPQGSISVQKKYLFPPPPPHLKMIFFPLSRHVVFQLLVWPFCPNSSLFCIYFTLFISLFSFSFLLLPFSFLLLPFSFPFLPFSFTFPSFSLPLFIFFPSNDIGWYFAPHGEGVFSNI